MTIVSVAHSVLATNAGCPHTSKWVQGCVAVQEPHLCPSLRPQKKSKVHYHIAIIINYLGHCISLVALLVAFVLFLRLR